MSLHAPTTLVDALEVLAGDPSATVLAGGTDLMVAVNAGTQRATSFVSLRSVPELGRVEVTDDVVRIGATVTYARLLASDVTVHAPALAQAARTIGSPQIRNAGTIGGNVAMASPAGDTLPALVALGAEVEVARAGGRRVVPVTELLVGPKRTSLLPGELIVAVRVPIVRGPQEYRKVGVRNAMVIAVASLAFVADPSTRSIAVGLGSVGPVPLRAPEAEQWLAPRLAWTADGFGPVDGRDAELFGMMVAAAARPITDHRSTADYRRHAVGVLARRCLRAGGALAQDAA
jgi:CO/xanthine dehydrogenase FAD-binding subunit